MSCRTLLFGAGQGALQYMVNTASSRTFIGFLDNDESKHGSYFEGLPVYSPSQLEDLDFDQIVVSTQWALEVYKQLLDELLVPEEKVVLPQKKQLKKTNPFENPKSIVLGREIISGLSELAISKKVPLVADFGTLLGLVRDNDILPWDDDIDFAAPYHYAAEVEELLLEFISMNSHLVEWQIDRVTDTHARVVCLLLKFTDPKSELTQFTTSLCFRENKNGQSLHMPSLGMWYSPSIHFNHIELIDWKDSKVQVPFKYRDYLTFQYGSWQIPKKDMQLSDYANLNSVSFEQVEQAKVTPTKITNV